MLDRRDLSPIGYLKINKSTGKPVPSQDIVRGFEVSPDRYVVLTDADLREANPKATRTVDVLGFVGRTDIPAVFFDKPYYVVAREGSERALSLLSEAMERTKRLAVASLVIHTRQFVAAVFPENASVVLQLLRYQDELRTPEQLGLPDVHERSRKPKPAELEMAEQLVKSMVMTWDPSEYRDTYRRDVLALVERRAAGARPAKREPARKEEVRVLDLMTALKNSLSQEKSKKTPEPASRRRARRSA
jgi:DNA end-binding protein Ku